MCPDFAVGDSKNMKQGGLKRPVKVIVMYDDEDPRSERLLTGRRSDKTPPLTIPVDDNDEDFIVRFAQCSNERAPRNVGDATDATKRVTYGYQCGKPEKYEDVPLKVRKGDPASRVIQWVDPPITDCWSSALKAPAPAASASASATPVPTASASASASAPAPASATPSASATP